MATRVKDDEVVARLAAHLLGYIEAPTLALRREQADRVAREVFRQRGASLRREVEQGRFDMDEMQQDLAARKPPH